MDKKVILLIGIFILVFAFALNTSFAASNETIDKYKAHQIDSYSKKIINVNYVSEWDHNYNGKEHLLINVKKSYKSKYKIKSIKVRYFDENSNVKYKTYNIKNKIKVKLNIKKAYIDKLVVTYKTKGKIKNETLNLETKHKWKSTLRFYGKTANIILKENGYITYSPQGGWTVITYQKFKVTTKNIKYKLKTVKAFFFGVPGVELVKSYKGYGKNVMTTKIYDPYEVIGIAAFRIYYY